MKHSRTAGLLCALVAMAVSASAATPASDAVLGYLAVPNLETALAHVEAFAKTVSPETPPGALRGMLGGSIGDPGLAHIRNGAPIVVLVLRGAGAGGPPSYALFLPVTDAKPFEAAFATRGFKTRAAAGVLVAAPTAEALAAADGQRSSYGAIAASGARCDARVFVRTDLVMQTYGPLLRGGLDMALAQAETARQKASPAPGASGAKPEAMPAEAMKLVKLEARALVGILEDAASLRWDLSLETDAIRSESELTPRPGTALAELASMPAPTGPNPTRAIVGGGGLMSAAYQWDPKILTSFINRTLDSVAHDPEAAALLTPDVQSLVRSTMSWSTGYASVNMQGAPPAGLSSEMAMSVSDEAKVLETLEKATGLLSSGPVAQLYASMGLKGSGSVKRNVRRHAGVAVHRVNFDFGSKNVPAEQMALMKEMMKGMDVALTRGYYLASQDAAALDRMIDRVASGAAPSAPVELRAVATFGPGRHAYVDYDLVGLMRSMMSMLPKKPGDKPPVLPASGEPMTFAFGAGDGVLRAQARLPVRSFVEMTKSMSKAQGPAQKPKTP